MASEFSLSLSFDGIVLLRRDSEGSWTPVEEVSVEAPDLDAKMKRLLRKLRNRSGGDPGVDLILPDSEIRYFDCPLPEAPGRAAQRRAVEAALDGATPYALDELRYDWVAEGGRLQVAAIALQTVEEAESFVRAHGFAPRGLTARPGPRRFAGVPDFSPGPKPDRDEDAGSQGALADETGLVSAGDAAFSAGPGASDAPAAADVPAPDHAGDAGQSVAATPDTDTAAAGTQPGAEDAPAAPGDSPERPAGAPEAGASAQVAGRGRAVPASEAGESFFLPLSGDEASGAPPDLSGTEMGTVPDDDVATGHPPDEDPVAQDSIAEGPPAEDHAAAAALPPDNAEVPADEAEPEPGPAGGEAEAPVPAPPPEVVPEAEQLDSPQVAPDLRPELAEAGPPTVPAGPRAMLLKPQGGAFAAEPAAVATGIAGQRELLGPLADRAQAEGAGTTAADGAGAEKAAEAGAPSAPAAGGKPGGKGPGKGARRGRRGKRRETGGGEAPEGTLVAFASRRDAPPRGSGPGPVLAPPPRAGMSGRGSRHAAALAPAPEVAPVSAAPLAEASAPVEAQDEAARAEELARSLDPRAAGAERDEAERLTLFGARGQDAQIMAPPRPWGRYIAVATAVLVLVAAFAWYVSRPPAERLAEPTPPDGGEAIGAPERLSLAQPGARVPLADPVPPAAAPDIPAEASAPADGGEPATPDTAAPAADMPLSAPPAEPSADEASDTADPAPVAPTLAPDSLVAPAPDAVLPVEDRAAEIVIPAPDRAMVAPGLASLPDYADGPLEARLPQPQAALPPGGAPAEAAEDQDGIRPGDARDASPAAVVRDGRPPVVPPPRPGSAATVTAPPVVPDPLAGKRPRGRPEALVETSGTAAPRADGAVAVAEPRTRPDEIAEVAASDARADPAASASGLAPENTAAPRLRPSGIAAAAAPVRPTAPAPAPQVVSAPAVAPSPASTAPAGPIIPSRASVAREATREDVLALNRMNLIGVYGGSGDRRALVRLANGRYVKVEVGDDLDGGQVAAIGENYLTYVRRGQSVRLDLAGEG